MKYFRHIGLYFFLSLGLLSTSGTVTAESPPFIGCNTLGCIGIFGSIYIDSAGDISITTPDNADTSALVCTLSGGQYFTLKRTHPAFKEIYSVVLTSQATKKNLFLRAVPNSPDCEISYAVSYP